MKNQMTGNAGLFFVAWRLTREGWNVLPTNRNSRGADLYVVHPDDEDMTVAVQSKALSRKAAVPLGLSLDRLRSKWWVITVGANSSTPECYVLSLDEVRSLASRNQGGQQAYWLEAKNYMKPEYLEAWSRIQPD